MFWRCAERISARQILEVLRCWVQSGGEGRAGWGVGRASFGRSGWSR